MTIWSRIPHEAVKRPRPSGRLTPLYKYLVWGRGDSSFIENRSLAAVEPWFGVDAGVDQLAAAPKLILFEGTDDFFGFS